MNAHDCRDFVGVIDRATATDTRWDDALRQDLESGVRECPSCRSEFAARIAADAQKRITAADAEWVREFAHEAVEDLKAMRRAAFAERLRDLVAAAGRVARGPFHLEPSYGYSFALSGAPQSDTPPQQFAINIPELAELGVEETVVLEVMADSIDVLLIPASDEAQLPPIALLGSNGAALIAYPPDVPSKAGHPVRMTVWSRGEGSEIEATEVLTFPVVGAVLGE